MRRGVRFPQWWMLLVAILSILSGQGSLVGMERFAKRHRQTLNELLGTDFGKSPSDSTFRLLLAQLDIDHFKRVNDTHGHATGDRALQAFAGIVRASVRDTDVLARWGGDEFVLLLSDTQMDDARDLLERVRQAVAAMEIPHAAGVLRMTVSAGLALHLPGDMVEQTLERADQALYTAKSLGRNRVVVAPSGPRAARASAASS